MSNENLKNLHANKKEIKKLLDKGVPKRIIAEKMGVTYQSFVFFKRRYIDKNTPSPERYVILNNSDIVRKIKRDLELGIPRLKIAKKYDITYYKLWRYFDVPKLKK